MPSAGPPHTPHTWEPAPPLGSLPRQFHDMMQGTSGSSQCLKLCMVGEMICGEVLTPSGTTPGPQGNSIQAVGWEQRPVGDDSLIGHL